MHSNVTIKNVSWLHFSWPTLYIIPRLPEFSDVGSRFLVSVVCETVLDPNLLSTRTFGQT